jgi:hypothetical protein
LNIPARPDAPTGVTGIEPTTPANTDGKIIGVTDALEYSANGTAWTAVSGTEVTGLAPGAYVVRKKAVAATSFASANVAVTIEVHVGVIFDEGSKTATVTANVAGTRKVLFAAYNDGFLVRLVLKDVLFEKDEPTSVTENDFEPDGADSVLVFVWGNLQVLAPLMGSFGAAE